MTGIKDVCQHTGLSQLLDTFPLATEIIVGNGDHRLATPSRLLVDPSHPQPSAELHVKVDLKSHADSTMHTRTPPKLQAFDCVLILTVVIGSGCQIDWGLAVWGRLVVLGRSILEKWPAILRTPKWRTLPFCMIGHREIASMTIDQPVVLDMLSEHLEQRRQLGWGEIKRWELQVTSYSTLPRFLSQNRHITHLEIERMRTFPISIGGFLTIDWSPLRRTTRTPRHDLKVLTIRVDFSNEWVGNISDRIRDIIEPRDQFPVFGLRTLVLLIVTDSVGRKAMASLPPYSQIAKLLVHIYGHHFELEIEGAEVDAFECPFTECLKSQLVKEVKLRQEEVARGKI